MVSKETEYTVRLADVEGIHGLIKALTEVAAASVDALNAWSHATADLHDSMLTLKSRIIELNQYVDEHIHDD